MTPVSVDYRLAGPGTASRLIIFAAFAIAGISFQILTSHPVVGALLIIFPMIFLTAKPWTNKPKDLGEEDWQAVGMAELDRLADAFRATGRIQLPFWYYPFSGLPLTIVLALVSLFLSFNGSRLALLSFDALLLFWPVFHFLRVRLWIDHRLKMVLDSLQSALSLDLPEGLSITPYLRLDRDANGLRIPEDARLMVEKSRKKEDLIGVQLQVAINNGPDGEVPYLYAVVLTRGKGPTWRIASAFNARGCEVESGGDGEYGTVVIRQETSGGGYHTTDEDCRRLMMIVFEFLKAL